VSELWHVSEDRTIDVFHPHHGELHALDEPLVWAVDTHSQWLIDSTLDFRGIRLRNAKVKS